MIDKFIFNLERKKYFFLSALFGVLVKEGLGVRIISAIILTYNTYKYNEIIKTAWIYYAMTCIPFFYICLAIVLVIGNFVLYKYKNDYMSLFIKM